MNKDLPLRLGKIEHYSEENPYILSQDVEPSENNSDPLHPKIELFARQVALHAFQNHR